jgi:hypothetical protein
MSDLDIPTFLRRPRSTQPLQLVLARVNRKRWSKLKTTRPEGDTWANAELRDVFLFDEAQPIGCGRRLVWVREGRRWCKLAGLDGSKVKIPMATWAIIARRKVS